MQILKRYREQVQQGRRGNKLSLGEKLLLLNQTLCWVSCSHMVLYHPKAEHKKAAEDYDKSKGCISPTSHRFPATTVSEGHKKIFFRAKREGGLI